jgi:hypothetical protein
MRRPTGPSALSASVELVCVDPKRVHEVWPHVAYLIRRAVKRTNLSHTRDIEHDILRGNGLLWLAFDGQAVKAAATTSLIRTDRDIVCVLTACGGDEMDMWLPLLSKIEAYAKAEGCACVRIYGRKGWARVLDGYRIDHVILRKAL